MAKAARDWTLRAARSYEVSINCTPGGAKNFTRFAEDLPAITV